MLNVLTVLLADDTKITALSGLLYSLFLPAVSLFGRYDGLCWAAGLVANERGRLAGA